MLPAPPGECPRCPGEAGRSSTETNSSPGNDHISHLGKFGKSSSNIPWALGGGYVCFLKGTDLFQGFDLFLFRCCTIPFFGTRSSKQPGGCKCSCRSRRVTSLIPFAVRNLSWLLLYKPGKKGKTLKIKSCTADQSTSQAESVQSARQSHTFEANHITHGQALKIAWQCNIL